MAKQEEHHWELVRGLAEQLKPIFDNSPQGIYLYLDDTHKTCNKQFAALLGYESVQAWEEVDAPLADVVEAHQSRVIETYERASEKMEAGSLKVTMKNPGTGDLIKVDTIAVPVAYQGHVMVLYFLNKV